MYERKINYDDMLNDLDSFEANVPSKRAGNSSTFNLDSLVDNIDSLIEKTPEGYRSRKKTSTQIDVAQESTRSSESISKKDYDIPNRIPTREHMPVGRSLGKSQELSRPNLSGFREMQQPSQNIVPPRSHPSLHQEVRKSK